MVWDYRKTNIILSDSEHQWLLDKAAIAQRLSGRTTSRQDIIHQIIADAMNREGEC